MYSPIFVPELLNLTDKKINQQQLYLAQVLFFFFSLDQWWYSFEVLSRIGSWLRGITFAAIMSQQLLSHFNTLKNLMHTVNIYVVTWSKLLSNKVFSFSFTHNLKFDSFSYPKQLRDMCAETMNKLLYKSKINCNFFQPR